MTLKILLYLLRGNNLLKWDIVNLEHNCAGECKKIAFDLSVCKEATHYAAFSFDALVTIIESASIFKRVP